LSNNKKKKSGSRAKTQHEQVLYNVLEKTAPSAGTTVPEEVDESSFQGKIAQVEYMQPQKERHRIFTPDEIQAAKKPAWISLVPIVVAVIALAFWAGKLQMRVETNDSSIEKIGSKVDNIDKRIDERINELRISMAKIESANSVGKNTQSDYQTLKAELANLQQAVRNMETISEKRSDEIRQLIVRMSVLEKTSTNGKL